MIICCLSSLAIAKNGIVSDQGHNFRLQNFESVAHVINDGCILSQCLRIDSSAYRLDDLVTHELIDFCNGDCIGDSNGA